LEEANWDIDESETIKEVKPKEEKLKFKPQKWMEDDDEEFVKAPNIKINQVSLGKKLSDSKLTLILFSCKFFFKNNHLGRYEENATRNKS
jgi:hypothetical protein